MDGLCVCVCVCVCVLQADLAIRGAGEILGYEQSGEGESIGEEAKAHSLTHSLTHSLPVLSQIACLPVLVVVAACLFAAEWIVSDPQSFSLPCVYVHVCLCVYECMDRPRAVSPSLVAGHQYRTRRRHRTQVGRSLVVDSLKQSINQPISQSVVA
jgi:hypothetical protein